MQIECIEPVAYDSWSETCEQNHDKMEKMHQEYRNSLLPLGFDPKGKDLLEIIAFLASELNTTKAELADLKDYTRKTFYKFSYGDLTL